MDESVLVSVKKVLGVPEDYTAFDFDIIMHINSVFSILYQMGIGPEESFYIEDDGSTWGDFFSETDLNVIRSYVFLRVRMLFDPPTTSFLLDAMTKQIQEFEWRISTQREWNLDPVDPFSEEVA